MTSPWHSRAAHDLAETLCSMDPPARHLVQALMRLCPLPHEGELLSPRAASALAAVAKVTSEVQGTVSWSGDLVAHVSAHLSTLADGLAQARFSTAGAGTDDPLATAPLFRSGRGDAAAVFARELTLSVAATAAKMEASALGVLMAPLMAVINALESGSLVRAKVLAAVVGGLADSPSAVVSATLLPLAHELLPFVANMLGSLESMQTALPSRVVGNLRSAVLRLADALLRVAPPHIARDNIHVDTLYGTALALVRSPLDGAGRADKSGHAAAVGFLTTVGTGTPERVRSVFDALAGVLDDQGESRMVSMSQSLDLLQAVVSGMARLTTELPSLRRAFVAQVEDVLFSRWFMAALSLSGSGADKLRATVTGALRAGLLDASGELPSSGLALLSTFVLELSSRISELADVSAGSAAAAGSSSKASKKKAAGAGLSRTLAAFFTALLADVTLAFNEPSLSKLVVNGLVSSLDVASPPSLHKHTVEALTSMALGSPPDSATFSEVISLFTHVVQREISGADTASANLLTASGLYGDVADAFGVLGEGVSLGEQRSELAARLAQVFVLVAKQNLARLPRPDPATPHYPHASVVAAGRPLLPLLPAFVSIMSKTSTADILCPNAGTAKLLHSLWAHMVLFEFATEGSWPSAVTEQAGRLAARMPVLLVPGLAHSVSELLTEINTSIAPYLASDALSRYTAPLAAALPDVSRTTLSALGVTKAFYTYAVFLQETLRAGSLLMFPILVYLENFEVVGLDNVYEVLRCLPKHLTAEFVMSLEVPAAHAASPVADEACATPLAGGCGCRSLIEDEHAIFLLAAMASQFEPVRRVAWDAMLTLLRASRTLLTSVRSLRFLLDLMEVLATSLTPSVASGPASGAGTGTQRPEELTLRLPGGNHVVSLPLDVSSREAALHNVGSLASAWLSAAMQAAPAQVQSVISDLLLDFDRLAHQALPHLDSLALRVGSLTDPVLGSLVSDEAAKEHTRLAGISHRSKTTFATQLVREAYHAGEVDGLYVAGVDVADALKSALGRVHGWDADAASLCYTAGAHCIACVRRGESIDRDLLAALVYVPVRAFTPLSLENAASIWVWLATRIPDAEPALFSHIVDMWDWTIDARVGLFSQVSANDSEGSDPAEPHRIWLVYLMERLTGLSVNVGTVRPFLRAIVAHSLHDPRVLSHHPSALPARIALLSLGLSLATGGGASASGADTALLGSGFGEPLRLTSSSGRSGGLSRMPSSPLGESTTSSGLPVVSGGEGGAGGSGGTVGTRVGPTMDLLASLMLRDQVYNGLLMWFASDDAWFRGSQELNTESMRSLVLMGQRLRADGELLESLLEGLSGADASLSDEFVPLIHSLQDRRQLGVVLIAGELERLAVWTNPLGKAAKVVEGVDEFPFPAPSSEPKLWQGLMAVAWGIHPPLAIYIVKRYPASVLRLQVEAHVRGGAAALVNMAEAIPFLVTEANIRANAPALRLLSCWAPCDTATAVGLLDWKALPPHNAVVQYALRVLRTEPVLDIIFYIPQLVQALRVDAHRYIARFLREVSRASSIVAHQLLWNMKTYQEMDADGVYKDAVLGPLCTRLEEELIAGFSPADEKFYHDEWTFFESVTQISGVLVDLKGQPDEQRARLYKELETIVVGEDQTLYLPSNVGSLVRGIKYGSGVCLKSAEKVPILIFFSVEESDELYAHSSGGAAGLDTLPGGGGVGGGMSSRLSSSSSSSFFDSDSDGDEAGGAGNGDGKGGKVALSSGAERDGGPLKWQGCIFKVGDDVRQDMLALQIIKLFDAQYKAVGLPVFLYPYNVVATGPGSGVIEVVPNAKSRDELGRANELSLKDLFISRYGPEDSADYAAARHEFIASTAAYSVACYLLRLVDRHSGNIMLLGTGQLIHIDFGFIGGLSSPGGDLGFERAPFKLTVEMAELMGGYGSAQFDVFRELVVKAYLAVRPLASTVVSMFELLSDTDLPCFKPGLMPLLLDRFKPHLNDKQAAAYANKLVDDAYANTYTYLYDKLQFMQNKTWYKPTGYKEEQEVPLVS